jgi:hypothetical protein
MRLDTGTEVGRYVSPLKRFTLPDLFASERGGWDWLGAGAKEMSGSALAR